MLLGGGGTAPLAGDRGRHAGGRAGGDGVDRDAVTGQRVRAGVGQPDDAHLGRRVVGLTGCAVQTGDRGEVDDPVLRVAVPGRAPVRRRELRGVEGALEVHPDHVVPLVLGHVEHHPVPQDARHVHQHVEPAELGERGADELLRGPVVGDVGGVGDGLAARRHDLLGDQGRGTAVGARTVEPGAEIVDHHLRALARERSRHRGADSPARSGHDRDPSVQASHAVPPSAARFRMWFWNYLRPGRGACQGS